MKRIFLVLSVAALMAATMMASALPAFAVPSDENRHGSCRLGGQSDNGAEGCAGNIGGTVENNQTGECKETNQGPFADRKEFRCKGNPNR
jgi:hypothetical protein